MSMELKPCPFCGGEANIIVLTSMPPKYQVAHACSVVAAKPTDTAEEAIEAWNTRAERTCELEITIHWDNGVAVHWEHELSCGHTIETLDKKPPNYCSECGRRVINVR